MEQVSILEALAYRRETYHWTTVRVKHMEEACERECDAYVSPEIVLAANRSTCDLFLDLQGWNHYGQGEDSCTRCGGPSWLEDLADDDADLCRAQYGSRVETIRVASTPRLRRG